MLSTNFVPGAPNWVDLGTPDVDAAAAFYAAVFGWEFQSAGPDAGGYGIFRQDGKTVAAAGPLLGEGALPSWTIYFATQDANATADAVKRAAGEVRADPFDVFTQGRMAQFTDPAGATAFYQAVFGWVTQDMPMGEFTYTVIRPAGGGEDSGQGGIMPLSPEMAAAGLTTRWQAYFEVADCDAAVAAAAQHGGTVTAPAEDIPGVGRMASLADPAGAPFAVITSVAP